LEGFILVTGGTGFIGSHFVDRLVGEGFRVRVVDNLSSGRRENIKRRLDTGDVELMVGDLKDPQVALKAVEGIGTVFHFAANPEVRVSTTNPEVHFNENVVATFNLLEAIRKSDVKEIVFASSSTVYGEPGVIPVSEDAPIKPVSVYGASKAACESLIHAYSKLYSIKAVIVRYANVVGPRLKHGVIWDFIMKLREDPNMLEILGDGKQEKGYIYIDDAVEATMMAWKKTEQFDVYNVASNDWITVDEIADLVIESMKLKDVRRVYRPVLHGIGWPGDVKKIALKIDKLKSIGFTPKKSSREAIKATAEAMIKEIAKGKF
jgi:UDP-glucose 4-epimerase